jgi:DNA repair protein RadC
MSWYYECNGDTNEIKYNDFEDVVFAIVSTARFDIEEHNAQNYYIYNDNILYSIIKASELDPYSKISHNWNDEQQQECCKYTFSKLKGDVDSTIEYLTSVVYGIQKYDKDCKKEIKMIEQKIDNKKIKQPENSLQKQMAIKEHKLCFDYGRNPIAKVNHIYFVTKREFTNIRSIIKILRNIYELDYATEEYSYIMAFDSAMDLIGILPLAHGTENSSDIDIKILYKYLLLVGAYQFVLVHNHPNRIKEMSQADFEKTVQIESVADLLDIKMIDHVIVAGNEEVCLLSKVHQMIENGVFKIEDNYAMIFN